MSDVTIYFGPPGTGKTATLLNHVKEEINRGVDPSQIAYVAFTRRAAYEAKERARKELFLTDDDLFWWRTLHSTAAQELHAVGRLVVSQHWQVLGEALKMDFSDLDESGRIISLKKDLGHRVQTEYYLRRSMQRSLEWKMLLSELPHQLAYHVCRFHKTVSRYKEINDLLDYADLLDEAPGNIHAKVVILDEAQDLTAQQWAYFNRIQHGAEKVIIAGDDEQAIFTWAGADVKRFLSTEGKRVVLNKSHRIPKEAYDIAKRISRTIRVKEEKDWTHNGKNGSLKKLVDPSRVPLHEGNWLLLSRTRAMLRAWEEVCKAQAVHYLISGADSVKALEVKAIVIWEKIRKGSFVSKEDFSFVSAFSKVPPGKDSKIWHEALIRIPKERRLYYEAILRRHGKKELVEHPRVRIDTIHGAKGAEADHVAIIPDLSPQIDREMRKDPDAEHRVWYVATTRCKESLHITRPFTNLYYATG